MVMPRMLLVKPSTIAAVVSIVGAVAAATLYLDLNDWFGAGDLPAMFFWSLPLGALCFFTIRRTSSRFAHRSLMARRVVLGLVGALTGILWTFGVVLILGAFIGAFSFPVLYCWTFGGLIGGVAAAAFVGREDPVATDPTAT
jgi:hypothetical protein